MHFKKLKYDISFIVTIWKNKKIKKKVVDTTMKCIMLQFLFLFLFNVCTCQANEVSLYNVLSYNKRYIQKHKASMKCDKS